MGAAELFSIRPFEEPDLPFISDSWGSSVYGGTINKKYLNPQEFHDFHRPIKERFLNRSTKHILVCCYSEDPDVILGWLAYEKLPSDKEILHYIYVKQSVKRNGIATILLKKAFPHNRTILFTHLTKTAKDIMRDKDKYQNLIYSPLLV